MMFSLIFTGSLTSPQTSSLPHGVQGAAPVSPALRTRVGGGLDFPSSRFPCNSLTDLPGTLQQQQRQLHHVLLG
jgi:hypothetical protein